MSDAAAVGAIDSAIPSTLTTCLGLRRPEAKIYGDQTFCSAPLPQSTRPCPCTCTASRAVGIARNLALLSRWQGCPGRELTSAAAREGHPCADWHLRNRTCTCAGVPAVPNPLLDISAVVPLATAALLQSTTLFAAVA